MIQHILIVTHYANLAKKTVSDKVLKERAYEVAINSKYDEYQRELANMVYTFFN